MVRRNYSEIMAKKAFAGEPIEGLELAVQALEDDLREFINPVRHSELVIFAYVFDTFAKSLCEIMDADDLQALEDMRAHFYSYAVTTKLPGLEK